MTSLSLLMACDGRLDYCLPSQLWGKVGYSRKNNAEVLIVCRRLKSRRQQPHSFSQARASPYLFCELSS